MSEHGQRDGAWQYTASDSVGSGVQQGRGKQGKKRVAYPPLTSHSSCPTPAENHLVVMRVNIPGLVIP